MRLKLRFSPIIAQSRDQIIIFWHFWRGLTKTNTMVYYDLGIFGSFGDRRGGQKWPPPGRSCDQNQRGRASVNLGYIFIGKIK